MMNGWIGRLSCRLISSMTDTSEYENICRLINIFLQHVIHQLS